MDYTTEFNKWFDTQLDDASWRYQGLRIISRQAWNAGRMKGRKEVEHMSTCANVVSTSIFTEKLRCKCGYNFLSMKLGDDTPVCCPICKNWSTYRLVSKLNMKEENKNDENFNKG